MKLGNNRPAVLTRVSELPKPDIGPEPSGEDRESLTAIATRLLPRVRNLIRYLIRGDQDVDDIAQGALLAVLRGLPSFRGQGSLESWAANRGKGYLCLAAAASRAACTRD
jgi:RNA polymerase sigma-70 factor (ECF subfamily)